MKTLQRYCISRKKTNNAERIKPTPRLNITRQQIGIIRVKNNQENAIPSIAQKIMKIINVRPKFMREDMFLENRNRYFGTLIFVKIPAFAKRDPIPPLVDSLKNEKIIFPENR